jgi:glycosyltransferase involved in cell wall biosynthesis
MEIAIVTEFFPRSGELEIRGGVEARAFYVAKHLAKRHEITVITSRERGTPRKDKFSGIEIIRPGAKRQYSQKGSLVERLGFIIGSTQAALKKFEIVDGYNFIGYPIAWRISRKQGIPAIATYHDVWVGEWIKNIGMSGIFGELLERYVLSRKWDSFIAVSSYVKKKLLKEGVNEGRLKVVPNGIEIKEYERVKTEKYPEPTVCCISRLVEYKHVDDLIKALNIVRKEIPNIKCKIVGTGPQEGYLRLLVSKLGLQEHVEFLGFVKRHQDLVRVLKSSQVLCLPSTVEGFGIVLLEAMAARVPFVATEIEPLIEATEKIGGLFVEPRNFEDLARKLSFLLSDEKLQKNLAKEGFKQALNYDWENIADRIEEVYVATMSSQR